jgi:mRNA interferase MazF
MRRGDIVTVSASGDYGRPRPAVIVQSDHLTQAQLRSVIVSLITSHIENAPAFRLDLEAGSTTGLRVPSQLMVDKLVTVPVEKVGKRIGRLDDETLVRLNRTLTFVVGLAG